MTGSVTSRIVFPCSLRAPDDLVVDVRQVHHLTDLPPAQRERAPHQILEQERAEVPEVRRVVDRRAARVHAHRSPSAGANGSTWRVSVLYRRNSDISDADRELGDFERVKVMRWGARVGRR